MDEIYLTLGSQRHDQSLRSHTSIHIDHSHFNNLFSPSHFSTLCCSSHQLIFSYEVMSLRFSKVFLLLAREHEVVSLSRSLIFVAVVGQRTSGWSARAVYLLYQTLLVKACCRNAQTRTMLLLVRNVLPRPSKVTRSSGRSCH
jgi:hypothetical protein